MAEKIGADTSYICVKALEKGVNIIGVTRGEVTKIHHTEKLDQGEVLIAQFTGEYLCHENQRESRGLYAVRHDSGRRSRY